MAWHRTGTASVTGGSPTVTGTGTAWLANVQVGLGFNGPDGRVYEILSVDSNTQLTLASNYAGSTASGAGYAIVPLSGYVQTTLQLVQQFLVTYATFVTTALAGLFGDGSAAAPGIAFAGDQDTGFRRSNANTLAIVTGGADRMEVGQAVAMFADTTTGIVQDLVGRTGDDVSVTRYLDHGRTTTRAQTGFGSTGFSTVVNVGGAFSFITSGNQYAWSIGGVTALGLAAGVLQFGPDNTYAFGSAGHRATQIFATTGTINTSDEREKEWRGALTTAELAAAREIAGEIGIYQWLDEIARKGADNARLHCGPRAQRVWAIMADHGLIDPISPTLSSSRYAFLCYDKWVAEPAKPEIAEEVDELGAVIVPFRAAVPAKPAGDRYGVRPDQVLFFIAAAQEIRLRALEALAA